MSTPPSSGFASLDLGRFTNPEVLEHCDVDTAKDFKTAKQLLNSKTYDLVVLDIMGVQGYDLLEIAREKR